MSLWAELKRRNVFKVGAAYALIAWIIAQVVVLIEEPLSLPDWFDTTILVFLGVGFPMALVFAWAYELTPAGLKRTDDVPAERSITRRTGKKLNYLLIGLVAGAIVGTGSAWLVARDADMVWMREEAIPELARLIEVGDWEAAYALAAEAQQRAPDAPEFGELLPRFSRLVRITSEPAGARVFRRAYESSDEDWQELGITPLEQARVPIGLSRFRLELEGYEPVLRVWAPRLASDVGGAPRVEQVDVLQSDVLDPVKLSPSDTLPDGKVRVPGFVSVISGTATQFEDFFLDRYEVTNAEYKAFVDAGGYRRREFWEYPIVRDGEPISWEDGMSLFVDRTGRPGPSTWEAGDYPDGQENYPVGGVSWYEAAAYAKFVDQELPTMHHLSRIRNVGGSYRAWQLPASNLEGDGPAPVGRFDAPSWVGAYDLLGNVREWIFNTIGDQRYTFGGGWNDPYSVAMQPYAQPPIDRLAVNGFRLAITRDEGDVWRRARAELPPPREEIDHSVPQVVSEDVFEVYRSIYTYDEGLPLNDNEDVNDRIEGQDWTRERITFDTPYGERMALYLYLPRLSSPPYQTVVFAPPGDAWLLDSVDHMPFQVDFVVKTGRAVALPILKGSFERRDAIGWGFGNWNTSTARDRLVQIVQDLSRSLDYLESRREIDSSAIAYYGNSAGAVFAPLSLATEPRFRLAILTLAGFTWFDPPFMPEIDPGRFLSRVEQPVLMMNGELDTIFPLETHARPWFERISTPDADKKHVVEIGGHFIPRDVLVRETLDWLDAHFGPVTQ